MLRCVGTADETIYESRQRIAKLIGAMVVVIAGGGFLVAVVSSDDDFRWRSLAAPVGILGIVFGLVMLAVMVPRTIVRRPVLVLSDEGFTDGTVMGGGIFIPWQEITELSIVRLGSADNIFGRVEAPERLLAEKRGWARWASRLNRRFADFWISDATLPEPASAVIKRMRARRDKTLAGEE